MVRLCTPLLIVLTLLGLEQTHRQLLIRYIDFGSEKPIGKLHVRLKFWNGRLGEAIPPGSVVREIEAVTDDNGAISVEVPNPPSDNLSLSAAPWDLQDPGTPSFSLIEVLVSGTVVPYKHANGPPTPKIRPQAGEIVVACKRLRTVDRMRREVP